MFCENKLNKFVSANTPSPWLKLSLYEYIEQYYPGRPAVMEVLKLKRDSLKTWKDFAESVAPLRHTPGFYLEYISMCIVCDEFLGKLSGVDLEWAQNQNGDWFRTSERYVSMREVLFALMKFYPELEEVQVWSKPSLFEFIKLEHPGSHEIMKEMEAKQNSIKTFKEFAKFVSQYMKNIDPTITVTKSSTWAVCQDYLGNLQNE